MNAKAESWFRETNDLLCGLSRLATAGAEAMDALESEVNRLSPLGKTFGRLTAERDEALSELTTLNSQCDDVMIRIAKAEAERDEARRLAERLDDELAQFEAMAGVEVGDREPLPWKGGE